MGLEHLLMTLANLVIRLLIRLAERVEGYWRMNRRLVGIQNTKENLEIKTMIAVFYFKNHIKSPKQKVIMNSHVTSSNCYHLLGTHHRLDCSKHSSPILVLNPRDNSAMFNPHLRVKAIEEQEG